MTYAEACDYLYSLSPLGVQLGTERIARALQRLGDPQRRYPALHIAGTNGKGSTAALSAALLVTAGREAALRGLCPRPPRVGLYTSPHLLRLTERIQISDDDGQLRECSQEEFSAAVAEVQAATAPDADGQRVELTFFELLTAAAFVIFARHQVAIAVVETGLGGRLDATRLCQPVATAITSIALDHCELLGPTLPQIAFEKAGIFKPGVPAYVACDDLDALGVIAAQAAACAAPLAVYPTSVPPLPESLIAALSLAGDHQPRNAALALALVRHAPAPLAQVLEDPEVIRAGLAAARWPGRLERVLLRPDGAEVYLDAAHNPEGTAALARWLQRQPARRPRCVLFGVVSGKQVGDMLTPLRDAAAIVLCRPPSPRGRTPQELVPLLRAAGVSTLVHVEPEVAAALTRAQRLTPAGGLLLVYGSIFLVAEARRLLLCEPADPCSSQDPMR